MERTTKGLWDFLCIQMEKLDKKLITIEDLKAQSNSAKQLNNILKYELDRAKALQKFPEMKIREVEDEEK